MKSSASASLARWSEIERADVVMHLVDATSSSRRQRFCLSA